MLVSEWPLLASEWPVLASEWPVLARGVRRSGHVAECTVKALDSGSRG